MVNRKQGATSQRIYKLLHRTPDLTTNEIASHLSDLPPASIQVTVSRMRSRGDIESRGKKPERASNGKMVSHPTYHVKYKARTRLKLKKLPPVQALRTVQTPVVEALNAQPAPRVERPAPGMSAGVVRGDPVAPKTEREVLTLRHLADIYKSLHQLAEQQDALIAVLKDTLIDLAETKEELEQERRIWWDKFKGWFA